MINVRPQKLLHCTIFIYIFLVTHLVVEIEKSLKLTSYSIQWLYKCNRLVLTLMDPFLICYTMLNSSHFKDSHTMNQQLLCNYSTWTNHYNRNYDRYWSPINFQSVTDPLNWWSHYVTTGRSRFFTVFVVSVVNFTHI